MIKKRQDGPTVLRKTSRVPIWLRIALGLIVSCGASFGLFWIAYAISGATGRAVRWNWIVFGVSAVLIFLSGLGVRLSGDRMGFGAKRILLTTLTGTALLLVLAGTVAAYLLL